MYAYQSWEKYDLSIQKVVINDGALTVGSNAFKNCTNLTAVKLPEGVVSIQDSAFYGCSGLVNLTIPKSVKTIYPKAFQRCSLTSITVSRNCYISANSFDEDVVVYHYN